uniref:Putative rna and export factor binding protein 1 n=1 Tax=Corethrella appendiculata TaxID=1370023 RepID=U5ELI9_9DIPT
MVDKIEMSLDEIIKSSKQQRGSGGAGRRRSGPPTRRQPTFRRNSNIKPGGGIKKGGGRGGITKKYTRGDVNSAWKHDMFEGAKKNRLSALGPAKLLVSNLDYGVSESDINELFADFGPLKSASVHYDRSGRSLGTADVIFERKADAIKAMKQYNGVPLDGRPMSIQMATSEIPQPLRPVRISQNRTPVKRNTFGGGRVNTQRRGPPPARSNNRRNNNPSKTVEELDAELDAYTKDMK